MLLHNDILDVLRQYSFAIYLGFLVAVIKKALVRKCIAHLARQQSEHSIYLVTYLQIY